MRTVKVKEAPGSEPLTLEEVKLFLKVDTTVDDTLITSLISSARFYVEKYLNKKLLTQTLTETLDEFPSLPHELRDGPFQSLSSIVYFDEDSTEATWDSSNYFFDAASGRIALTEDGDTPTETLRDIAAVQITYIAGFGDGASAIPQPILDAMKIFVAHFYRNREPFKAGTIVSEIPFSMTALLDPFREIPI